MKNALIVPFLLWSLIPFAQTFTEVQNDLPFEQLEAGATAFADVDADGDQDVLLTGFSLDSGLPITKLYMNDGNGHFTEVINSIFEGVAFSTVAFADVDNDDDPDLLIAGRNAAFEPITKLYLNARMGFFEEDTVNLFEPMEFGSIAFEDVDQDNDLDLLLAGVNNSDEAVTILYMNDGEGFYVENTATSFEGVLYGSIAFADINGDGFSDLLITGQSIPEAYVAKLYMGTGNGSFTEVPYTSLKPVSGSSVAFVDVDGDTDKDVFISGGNHFFSNTLHTQLYINDGMGNYSEDTTTSLEGIALGSIAIADADFNGAPDILITGMSNLGVPLARLYINDGMATYSEVPDTPFQGVSFGTGTMVDVNGDEYPDVLISGRDSTDTPITRLYLNNGPISSIVENKEKDQVQMILYPNPNQSGYFQIRFDSRIDTTVNVQVFNSMGILFEHKEIQVSNGPQNVGLSIPKLAPGIYHVLLDAGDWKNMHKLVIH
ncbi:MAG: T9SS type A sorting domain-containing protein [Cyanothece sp. SIO1E1]|nr:T9SS type A sorting domain-containing protein [Cyanothece sp. SIO1E1]